MSFRSLKFLPLVLALFALPAHAQYASVAASEAQQKEANATELEAARQLFIGREYWIVPNPQAIGRRRFSESSDTLYSRKRDKFVVTEPTSFKVTGFVPDSIRSLVQVTFADGKVAYLEEATMFRMGDHTHLFNDEYDGHGRKLDFIEYVMTASPEQIAATEKKDKAKAAAAAAAWKARGGVRIGMTKKQVLASNWGRPEHVNVSTGSYGTHEQWVYGGSNYLYFENGVLTSIQN